MAGSVQNSFESDSFVRRYCCQRGRSVNYRIEATSTTATRVGATLRSSVCLGQSTLPPCHTHRENWNVCGHMAIESRIGRFINGHWPAAMGLMRADMTVTPGKTL